MVAGEMVGKWWQSGSGDVTGIVSRQSVRAYKSPTLYALWDGNGGLNLKPTL
jgi:hypothetical protein